MTYLLSILILLMFPHGLKLDTIEEYLHANLIDFDSFEFRLLPNENELKSMKIDESREFILKNKYGYIPVVIKGKNGERKSLITVRLKLMKKVAVANHLIRRGEKISPEDFVFRSADVTNLRSEPVTLINANENLKSKVNIRKGVVLTKNMIEQGEMIFTGNKVKAIYEKGDVVITFDAEARTSGRAGEIIRVKRNDGIIFNGKIINRSEVKIIE